LPQVRDSGSPINTIYCIPEVGRNAATTHLSTFLNLDPFNRKQ
jgi:hypothetical protein